LRSLREIGPQASQAALEQLVLPVSLKMDWRVKSKAFVRDVTCVGVDTV
jgi:hypothetical protein